MWKIISLFVLSITLTCSHISFGQEVGIFSEEEMAKLNYSDTEWLSEIKTFTSSQETKGWTGVIDVNGVPGSDSDLRSFSTGGSGPQVTIINPTFLGETYLSTIPVTLLVYLKGEQAPIDIDSLVVKGKKGPFTVNITSRIKKFLRKSDAGENADYVLDAKLPQLHAGKYLVMVSLGDVAGNVKEISAFLEVQKK